ncbi:MAG: hypothetical protein A3E87_09015 [Gammaproteobacteria bacterium RIFCSPHIGHO2_12_FULL_35_23]|nr:MAG: hypothetical protein A3E87_09015 [Gammaproteobacteria bacterium RIFCSPHIGHO2_12_FULL_35_23]
MEVLNDVSHNDFIKYAFIIIAGCMLEMYDFVVYSFFAVGIAQLFFPEQSFFNSLLLSYGTFAIGYFTRPLGATFFGYLSDTKGRKVALIYSVLCMGIPIFLIGILPTYQTIGFFAPLLLLIFRTAQGLSLGGEISSAIAFFSEYSKENRRAFTTCWVFFGLNFGIVVASLFGTLIIKIFTHEQIMAGAWRILFILGGVTAVIIYLMRKKLYETPKFTQLLRGHLTDSLPLLQVFKTYKKKLVMGFFIFCIVTTATATLFLFMPIYLYYYLNIKVETAYLLNTINLIIFTCLIPLIAILADKFGRKPILIIGIIALIFNCYPLFLLLTNPNHLLVLWALLSLGIPTAFLFAPIGAVLAELFSTPVRTTGLGIVYNLNSALFLGLTPVLLLLLIKYTHSLQAPALYLIITGFLSLIATLFLKESKDSTLDIN